MIIERIAAENDGSLNFVKKMLEPFAERNQLTPRESEMAGLLLVYGYSNQELADHCAISVKTVKNHLDNMMRKLGIHSTRRLYSMLLQSFYEEKVLAVTDRDR